VKLYTQFAVGVRLIEIAFGVNNTHFCLIIVW